MANELRELIIKAVGSQEQAAQLLEKLFTVAQPGTVFSAPTVVEGHTIITASEVSVTMGVGYGVGGEAGEQPEEEQPEAGVGGGGGGGGVSMGRPVAVISVDAEGVHVEPVVDATKIALTLFTMAGSVLLMIGRLIKAGQNRD